MKDANENAQLKSRLQELHEANFREKAELESQMSTVIHSQAGELAAQKQKLSTLQSALQQELALSQNKIAEQEKEINWLKRLFENRCSSLTSQLGPWMKHLKLSLNPRSRSRDFSVLLIFGRLRSSSCKDSIFT
jgi:chromosome segregation ATPase